MAFFTRHAKWREGENAMECQYCTSLRLPIYLNPRIYLLEVSFSAFWAMLQILFSSMFARFLLVCFDYAHMLLLYPIPVFCIYFALVFFILIVVVSITIMFLLSISLCHLFIIILFSGLIFFIFITWHYYTFNFTLLFTNSNCSIPVRIAVTRRRLISCILRSTVTWRIFCFW